MSKEKDRGRRPRAMAPAPHREEIDKSLKKKVKEKPMYESSSATHDPKKEHEQEKPGQQKPGQQPPPGQKPGQGGGGQQQPGASGGQEAEKQYVEVAGGAPHEVKPEGEGESSGGGAGGSKSQGGSQQQQESGKGGQ